MFLPSRIDDIRAGQAISINIVLPVYLIAVAAYLLFINILVQIGMEPTAIDSFILLIIAAIYLYGIIAGRTMEISQHVMAGRQVDPLANAMAGSAEWISIFLIIGLSAAFSNSNHDALAIICGIIAGIAIMAAMIIPTLRNHSGKPISATLSQLLAANFESKSELSGLLRIATALIISFCAGILLITQINAGEWLLSIFFPQTDIAAKYFLIIPPIVLLVFGGMRSVTITNALFFWLILGAVLLPTTWISLQLSGNPVPQFSYGHTALRAIVEIDEQFRNTQSGDQVNSFGQLSGMLHFLGIFICVLAGSAVFPLLFGRTVCCGTQAHQGRSTVWTIVLICLTLSFVPAYLVFSKFEIYRDLVGLAILDIPDTIQWIFNWASIEEGQHARICGQPAFDLATVIQSCGGDGDHILGPNDLGFSARLMILALGEIAELPQIISALIICGIIAAGLSTIAMSLMVMANSLTHDVLFAFKREAGAVDSEADFVARAPIVRRLFVARLLIVVLGLLAVWLSGFLPLNENLGKNAFYVWVFSLSAILFATTALVLWWRGTTLIGALMGMISGFFLTLFLQIQITLGADFIGQNGDEIVLQLPYFGAPITALDCALISMPVTIILIVAISTLERWFLARRNRENHQTS